MEPIRIHSNEATNWHAITRTGTQNRCTSRKISERLHLTLPKKFLHKRIVAIRVEPRNTDGTWTVVQEFRNARTLLQIFWSLRITIEKRYLRSNRKGVGTSKEFQHRERSGTRIIPLWASGHLGLVRKPARLSQKKNYSFGPVKKKKGERKQGLDNALGLWPWRNCDISYFWTEYRRSKALSDLEYSNRWLWILHNATN